MAYIGKQPVVGNFVKLDAIVTSATATYNLLNGGTAYFPQTANNCIVSLNGVIQSPTSAYTISGSTIVFDSALTSSDSIDFILVLGDVLAIGTPSDGTITSAKLASGTAGLIAWQSVQTTGFTASAGRGYPCNTTSAAFTVTLPASPSVGDTIILLDYAGTFATNKITLGANSNKINGVVANKQLDTNREAVTLTYVDSTQGWVASSGTNFGTQSIDPLTYPIDFLVVAGGGGGSGSPVGGGGGAGGFRTSTQSISPSTVVTVTVGTGGAGTPGGATSANAPSGVNSSISGSGLTTITSAGGGGGGYYGTSNQGVAGAAGGSGGGGGGNNDGGLGGVGGAGNTPSTSPSQGNNGGGATNVAPAPDSLFKGGGGGGAGAVGTTATGSVNGNGGIGATSSITGTSTYYAGGGAGCGGSGAGSTGGTGGGGSTPSGDPATGGNGTANTGGGGGGGRGASGGSGGSGVVILRMLTTDYSSTTTGSPTVTTDGSYKVLTFTGSGTYTG